MTVAKSLLAAVLGTALLFTGCGKNQSPAQTGAPPAEEPSPTTQPAYWADWEDPFTQEEGEALAARAAGWWEEQLAQEPRRYAAYYDIGGEYLPPDQWGDFEELARILDFSQGLDRAALEEGTAGICKVNFTLWYQPETYYLGPQYGDGACYLYLVVGREEAEPVEVLSGWYSQETQPQHPSDPGAQELGLNWYQYTILTHQCRALAVAGLEQFSSPEDWSAQELARYLVARGQDFGREPEEWPSGENDSMAGHILAIDFTGGEEWSNAPAPALLEEISPEDWAAALEVVDRDPGSWKYQGGKDQIIAVLEGNPQVQYTFALTPGFAEWNSRTFCTGAFPL